MTTGGREAGADVRGLTDATPPLPSAAVLRRRRYFFRHLLVYAVVNVLLVVAWLVAGMTTGTWFFWPVLVLVGWGLLLDVHAWWAYGRPDRTPARLRPGP
jgi:hypothetical protein